MIRIQSIAVPIDRLPIYTEERINEETKKGEEYFIPTEFDEKIMEFMLTVHEEGGVVISFQCFANNDYAIAFINYSDTPLQDLQRPDGNIVVPDLKIKPS